MQDGTSVTQHAVCNMLATNQTGFYWLNNWDSFVNDQPHSLQWRAVMLEHFLFVIYVYTFWLHHIFYIYAVHDKRIKIACSIYAQHPADITLARLYSGFISWTTKAHRTPVGLYDGRQWSHPAAEKPIRGIRRNWLKVHSKHWKLKLEFCIMQTTSNTTNNVIKFIKISGNLSNFWEAQKIVLITMDITSRQKSHYGPQRSQN